MNAINTALSGLNAASTAQAVTANNIANINTQGYKSRSVNFAENFGGGVKVSGVSVNNTNPYNYGGFRMDAFGNLLSPSGSLLFTGAGNNLQLDENGNLFENGEPVGQFLPNGFDANTPTGETLLAGFTIGSNVNVATEMVNNMVNLRYFQLNAVTVRTADDMLGTVVNLKA